MACVFLLAGISSAQSVDNVVFRQTEEDQVVVTYDLNNTGRRTFEVELWLSQDGGEEFTIQPRTVEGAIGEGVRGGRGKRIVWDVLSDIRKLEGGGDGNNALVWTVRRAVQPEPPGRVHFVGRYAGVYQTLERSSGRGAVSVANRGGMGVCRAGRDDDAVVVWGR